jgi:uncharacterized membrane protein
MRLAELSVLAKAMLVMMMIEGFIIVPFEFARIALAGAGAVFVAALVVLEAVLGAGGRNLAK